ncbi:MAG TPA: TolC family protein [Gemmatimonadales bacterium]|nr:TolC family protein [Gemmatimonadales bacterium]
MKSLLSIAAWLSVSTTAVAQSSGAPNSSAPPPTAAALSLADAIGIAREHNPAYRQILNNRAPAVWGARNAWASLIAPQALLSGGLGYSGTGSQRFLTSNFNQNVSTLNSNYSFGLQWDWSVSSFSQPGLRGAQLSAADADVRGGANALVAGVTQQYLTVLQASANADVAAKLLARQEETLKLAQARFQVGQVTLVDVRSAQVNRGQSKVALLRARTLVSVEKLRLFEQMGVTPPVAIDSVQLTDTFPVVAPPWKLDELLTMAEAQNPALLALRERERAASWSVKAASGSYVPSVSLSLGWSGFTQAFANKSDLDQFIVGQQVSSGAQVQSCQENNIIRGSSGLAPQDCSVYAWTAQSEQFIRDQQNTYPFNFIGQPFQARLSVSLPIWLNFQRPLQVSESKAQEKNLEESVRARALGVQTEVSQAFLALDAAYQSIAIQDTNRIAARERLQLATERYKVGSGTFLEVTDAEYAALQAETDYIAAVFDYHRSLALLEQAVGRSLR